MRKTCPTLFTALTLCSAAALAQTAKPGLWEVQQKMGGRPEMDQAMAQMQQQMASMSPEQRKMMQSMLAKQGMAMPAAAAGGGMAMKICITPEMAARSELPGQSEGDCTSRITGRSGNTLSMNWVCKTPPSTGEGSYTFTGDTAYTLKMRMKSTDQGKPVNTTLEGRGQWLAADCGSVKPPK